MKYRKTVLDYLVNGTLFYYKGKQYSVFMAALSNCSVDCSVDYSVDCSVEVNMVGSDKLEYLPKSTIVKVRG